MEINEIKRIKIIANSLKVVMTFLVLPGSFLTLLQALWEMEHAQETSDAGFGLVMIGPLIILSGLLVTGLIFFIGNRFYNYWFQKKQFRKSIKALLLAAVLIIIYDAAPYISMAYNKAVAFYVSNRTYYEMGGYLMSLDNPNGHLITQEQKDHGVTITSELAQLQMNYPKAEMYFKKVQYTKDGFTSVEYPHVWPVIFEDEVVRNESYKLADKEKIADIRYVKCGHSRESDCSKGGGQYLWVRSVGQESEFKGEGAIGPEITGKFVGYNPPKTGNYSVATFKTDKDKVYELWGAIENGKFIDWLDDGHNLFWSMVPDLIKSNKTVKIQITGPAHISNQHIKWIYR